MVRFRLGIVVLLIVVVACAANSVRPEGATPRSNHSTAHELDLTSARRELVQRFEELLDAPARLREDVRRTRAQFPEGDLFSYTFPAIAYAQLLASREMSRERTFPRMAQLIDEAQVSTTVVVRPPGGNLANLTTYQGHGVYLGQLNLALAWWFMVGGDERYREVHDTLTEVLSEGLAEREGRPLDSYPAQVWTIDTIPVLSSIAAHDHHAGTSLAPPTVLLASPLCRCRARADDVHAIRSFTRSRCSPQEVMDRTDAG